MAGSRVSDASAQYGELQGGYNVYPVEVENALGQHPDVLREWCAQRMANYEVPRDIAFMNKFPLTPAGKVHKTVLPRD